jgi:CO/xanthine dehydrogenase FAD-binding subunit
MKNFEYFRPETAEEAVELKAKYGDSARFLLGGTDLVIAMDAGALTPDVVIDIKEIEELKELGKRDGKLHIGANVPFNKLISSDIVKKEFPSLWEASKLVASVSVRNRATVVGNICNAVPSAESSSPLMARDAVVLVEGKDGKREIPISEFFVAPRKTSLKPDEMVTAVEIPLVEKQFGECYIKLGRYEGEDLAQVGVTTFVDEDKNYSVAFAAVGPVPIRAKEVEDFLNGKDLTDDVIAEAKELALKLISPISDIRASKEYRMHMAGVMLERSLKASLSRMNDGTPEYGAKLI